MVSLEEAVTARYESEGHRFEILIDPEVAYSWKTDPVNDEELIEALAADEVWKDAQRGDRASEQVIKEVFGTDELPVIVKRILEQGQLQLTTDQRREMVASKRRQVVAHIARNAINPQTNAPHPPARIDSALEEVHVVIDPFKSVEEQVKRVLPDLRAILPLRFEKVRMAVRLPAAYVGACHHDVVNSGQVIKEEYQSDGGWIGVVEMAAGDQAELLSRLGSRTHGEAQTKILK